MPTDLKGLKNLKIPSDLTKEQIFQMFQLVYKVTFYCQKGPYTFEQTTSAINDLQKWFMEQNFQDQISKKD